MASSDRLNISSGSWREPVLGYSRAVSINGLVFVAGTTASSSEGAVGGDDAALQAREILTRIGVALGEAGASFADVVRTRIYLTDIADFDAVGAVHGEIFSDIRPVTSVVEVGALAAPELVVEIEADAVLAL